MRAILRALSQQSKLGFIEVSRARLINDPGADLGVIPRDDAHDESAPGSAPGSSLHVTVGCTSDESAVGIHVFRLEVGERGPRLVGQVGVAGLAQPSYLAHHPTLPVLYAVSETIDGAVASFHVDPVDGTLTEWQRVPSGGDGPCHLSTDGHHLHVAHYLSGSVASHALAPDGRIADLVWTERHRGSGPHVRQDAPHAHCVVPDPHRRSIRSFHAVDLGTDRIVRYDADPTTGGFRAAVEVLLRPGSGPRHLAFHPTSPSAFVVCELDCTLVALEIDPTTGELTPRHEVSTLPDGSAGDSLAAAVRVHPDGQRVFVSNRGHDSIATFAVAGPGEPPTLLGHVASGGAGPREIVVEPAGRWLLAANQHSGEITGFALDDPTGLPRPLGELARVAEPACILVGAWAP
jgi:6-phosphogluconolactonase